jgi:hypothetical protein
MRVIKFRAWDGNKMTLPSAMNPAITISPECDDNSLIYVLEWDADGDMETANISVIYGLCMQFTGLEDYEDVEMYEGDVVQVEGLGKCVVSICPYNGVTFHDLNDQIIPVADCLVEQDQFRVIGNIHENPDLYK